MLEVRDLRVLYGNTAVVKDASFTIAPGEILSITGRSGSGKSTILHAIDGMLGASGRIAAGEVRLDGVPIMQEGRYTGHLKEVRGRSLAFISQYPDKSLDPLFTIGNQMTEVMRVGGRISGPAARQKGQELLAHLHIADSERVWKSYPHELSGGMCQRVAIAMALSNRASVLLADEPTSALDVTVQAELIRLLKEIAVEDGLAILLVTHNMDVSRALSDRIMVLKDGVLQNTQGKLGSLDASLGN